MIFNKVTDSHSTYHFEYEDEPYFIVCINKVKWRIIKEPRLTSEQRSYYINKINDKKIICECEAFRRSRKCRHVIIVNEFINKND